GERVVASTDQPATERLEEVPPPDDFVPILDQARTDACDRELELDGGHPQQIDRSNLLCADAREAAARLFELSFGLIATDCHLEPERLLRCGQRQAGERLLAEVVANLVRSPDIDV